MQPPRLPITFLSDYGLSDEFVGICHAVIERVAPGARVIDLGHGVPAGEVRQGAVRLADALPYCPPGVHLAVVDPGVGGARRAVAIRCGTRFLVGPDNGLLAPAAARFGGAREAVDIGASRFRLEPVSATFHGRDIFAPVTAQLALGTPLEAVGKAIDPASLNSLDLPEARVILSCEGNLIETEVLAVDGFGNVSLSAGAVDLLALAGGSDAEEDPTATPAGVGGGEWAGGDTAEFPESVAVELAGVRRRVPVRSHFDAVGEGEPVFVIDSSGRLALALNRSDAATRFSLTPGTVLRLS